jgi:hypothetical protein
MSGHCYSYAISYQDLQHSLQTARITITTSNPNWRDSNQIWIETLAGMARRMRRAGMEVLDISLIEETASTIPEAQAGEPSHYAPLADTPSEAFEPLSRHPAQQAWIDRKALHALQRMIDAARPATTRLDIDLGVPWNATDMGGLKEP